MMKAEEIRKTFLEFFKSKQHTIVPSAPIVVKNDPTLMFTNAGMNPFKDYFLGNKTATDKRVADTQKCLRVSGKHNDLEEVGIDTYHHTMFEMLGNWSFGDYFKKDAIAWAWELLTDVYKIDRDKLYVTVFEGDVKENLLKDEEAYNEWRKWIAEDRILNGNKKDNFWEMGDTGPCGPCSEIHIDLRSEAERKEVDGKTLVNNDHPQVIEIWNNVFMEFNRKADGSLEKLPAQHVDTGMGFERLVRALQGKTSNYDTDVFQPAIKKMENDFRMSYGQNEKLDIAFRVIADHIRAITFTIADGQLPSNTGAGYVIRRILRRAVRYGYTFLGMNEPYIYSLVTVLAQQFKEVFPEVIKQEDFIKKVIHEEEGNFLRTLAGGTKLFEKHIAENSAEVIDGKFSFELYDTFGFPIDLTQLMAREVKRSVDMEAFNAELQKQKERSRNAAAKEEGDWVIVNESSSKTEFLGYDMLEADVQILRYRKVSQKGKEYYQLVLDKTPFYPEGGGQVGDTGELSSANGITYITDTKKENDLILHFADELPADVWASFHAKVDKRKRRDTENNHSATHLLHAALRKVLGTHVAQKGSLVNEHYLRFDFSHFAKMTDEEIRHVEKMVNEKIRENIARDEQRSIPFNDAVAKGAMALFGEKYGDKVRMISFDPAYSVELCGGTHVANTALLGYFKITSQSAVAAGVRRIEAITGAAAETFIEKIIADYDAAKDILKGNKPLSELAENLLQEKKNIEKEKDALENEIAALQAAGIVEELNTKADHILTKQIAAKYIQNRGGAKRLVTAIEAKLNPRKPLVLYAADNQNKCSLWLSIPKENKSLNAGNIIKEIAPMLSGKGGGSPFYADIIGENSKALQDVLSKITSIIAMV